MRFFIVSYQFLTKSGLIGHGDAGMSCEKFLNRHAITNTIKQSDPNIEFIGIVNIIELSEQDALEFNAKDKRSEK